MTPSSGKEANDRALALSRAALARPHSPFGALPPRFLLVDVERQRLTLIQDGQALSEYRVSTSARGVGAKEGSFRTPPGWHRIHARIGQGEPPGAVFESRKPTGAVWRGEPRDEDLILTRILTLEGLEEPVNRGPGHDSLERMIYIHGTNHEERLGRPASHGCVRMANADVLELFERVREGDPLAIVGGEPAALPDPRSGLRFHYAGVGGSGMSALAQFQVMAGGRASGSDRAFDRGDRPEWRARLERLGIGIHPQDGSGVAGDCGALVVSTAVEEQVPDLVAARAQGIPVVHRSELLAHYVAAYRTIAVGGTSGKSTVVAMVFEILRAAGRLPSVITGGDLRLLQEAGLWGNAWYGASNLLVVEADESDGSLVRYEPAIGVILNLHRDHRETSEVAEMFAAFRGRTREGFVVGEGANLAALTGNARVFGFGADASVRGTEMALESEASHFVVDGMRFTLPVPGRHNVENALAAIATCGLVGVRLDEMVGPLARFRGVSRRFQSVGRANGIEVVDDFAHNPDKLRASIETARARARSGGRPSAGRVLAVYQPHGYGPTRFLRADLVDAFANALGPRDRIWLLEVHYAGGTALRDFSSADIVAEIAARGAAGEFAPSREWLVRRLAAEARDGDVVLVMGARDPSLTELARAILDAVGTAAPRPSGAPIKESA